ncbi:hypothetical protein V2J09_010295 [Rumex salicifolius]
MYSRLCISPSETVAGNADLLTEILSRLPAKSLLRFKSVSKEWQSLISSNFFVGLHRNKKISGVLLHRPSKSTLEFAFLDGESHRRPNPSNLPRQFGDDCVNNSIRILQSCNGLLLCSARRGPHIRTLHVYNPTTGALSSPAESPDHPTAATWMNLVFDPAESPHYQLISIHNFSNQIHRYSSATGNWSPCTSPINFRAPFNLVLAGGVYWRGSLHWLGPNSTNQDSFFLHVEHQKSGALPPVIGRLRKRRQSSLESSGGKLLLVEVYEEGEIRVLEMKEDYSGWEIRYEIAAIDGVSEVYPQVFGRAFDGLSSKIYCKFQVCCVVDMVVVMRIPGKILGFELESKKLWEMKDVLPSSDTASDFEWIDVFPFVETLAVI